MVGVNIVPCMLGMLLLSCHMMRSSTWRDTFACGACQLFRFHVCKNDAFIRQHILHTDELLQAREDCAHFSIWLSKVNLLDVEFVRALVSRTLHDLADSDIALGEHIKFLRCSSRSFSSCSTTFASFLRLSITTLLFRFSVASFLALLLLLGLSFFLLCSLRLLFLFFWYANLSKKGLERRDSMRFTKGCLHLEDEPV